MKKVLVAVGASLTVAALPAAVGFAGNSALSREVEVRTGLTTGPTPTPSASGEDGRQGDDTGTDDKGGLRPRDDRHEDGDDRDSGSGRGSRHSDDDAGRR
jgi:hypothetical protein